MEPWPLIDDLFRTQGLQYSDVSSSFPEAAARLAVFSWCENLRLRFGDEWYRIDLLFFHRRLRCLVIIDLKLDRFTHADAGQMHLYLNYARQHWMLEGENPPVGLVLCAEKDSAVARYALEGLPNKVLAAEYRTTLPDEKVLEHELQRSRKQLEARAAVKRTRRGKPVTSRPTRPADR